MDNLTIAICNFNTTELTNAAIRSAVKVGLEKFKFVVLDNSDKLPFALDKSQSCNVKVLDNTEGKFIDFKKIVNEFGKSFDENYGSMKHAASIQFLLNICQTDLMLLLDADVILKRNIDFIDCAYVSVADVGQRKTYKARSLPYVQLFNVKMMKANNIKFFDPTRIRGGLVYHNSASYDTGASFLEDVKSKNLPFKRIDFTDYVFHLRSASVNNKDSKMFLQLHKEYIEDGIQHDNSFDYKVVVSMTSWKKRIEDGSMTVALKSILSQKFNGKIKIVVTLNKSDYAALDNATFEFLTANDIEIIVATEDLKPHNKYFYSMTRWRNLPIITVDDDLVYDDDLVQSLYDSYKEFPDCVSARRTHKMMRYSHGSLLPYRQWIYEQNAITKTPDKDLFATGCGGVIYPEDCLKISEDCLPCIRKCLNADDIYLKRREQELKIDVVKAVGKRALPYCQQKSSTAEYALCFMNNTKSRCDNDIYIKQICLK